METLQESQLALLTVILLILTLNNSPQKPGQARMRRLRLPLFLKGILGLGGGLGTLTAGQR